MKDGYTLCQRKGRSCCCCCYFWGGFCWACQSFIVTSCLCCLSCLSCFSFQAVETACPSKDKKMVTDNSNFCRHIYNGSHSRMMVGLRSDGAPYPDLFGWRMAADDHLPCHYFLPCFWVADGPLLLVRPPPTSWWRRLWRPLPD